VEVRGRPRGMVSGCWLSGATGEGRGGGGKAVAMAGWWRGGRRKGRGEGGGARDIWGTRTGCAPEPNGVLVGEIWSWLEPAIQSFRMRESQTIRKPRKVRSENESGYPRGAPFWVLIVEGNGRSAALGLTRYDVQESWWGEVDLPQGFSRRSPMDPGSGEAAII